MASIDNSTSITDRNTSNNEILNSKVNSDCIFCKIALSSGQNTNTKVLYEDADVFAFPNIKPAAKHHTLVISREHILNAKVLTSEHKPLVEKMLATGKKLMQEQGIPLDEVRFGFHWPPFYSIGHLHLHVIAPISEMGIISKIIFTQNTWWFVSPEYVLSRL